MSSKRARRAKRRESFKEYDPEKAMPNPPKKTKKKEKEEPEYAKLPGQWWVRVGSALLLAGGLLSAIVVWYGMNSIKGLSLEDFEFFTSLRGQTPIVYMNLLIFTSILAVMQFAIGYAIFRNSRNPFMSKKFIIYAGIMIVAEVLVNIYAMIGSASGFQITSLFYGSIIPIMIIFGAYKNLKFAKQHPGYIPPEPTQMF